MSGYPRELIRASAGSGKTFRISSRIIGLLAAGEAPRAIFASTFTRKAAGEILERVLVRLARAALDDEAAAELAEHAVADPAARPSCDSPFWRDVLGRAVRELHRLDVATLDAFFVRAVTSFGHDLGLPSRWGIADDPTADRVRAEALQQVLGRLDDGARIELVRGLAGGGVRRSVHDALLRELDAILRAHRDLDPDAPGWSALSDALSDALTPRPDDLQDRCRALADRLAAADVPLTKQGTPNGNWTNDVARAADALRDGDWDRLIAWGLFRAGLDPTLEHRGSPVPDPLRALLLEAAELARCTLGPPLAARAAAMARLAALYADAYDDRLRAVGALRFDDVTRILAGARSPGGRGDLLGRDDLFYRLDGDTLHLLLDEFQDTSLGQWTALEPLADGLLGAVEPGAAVIVADPKQSIYGWRGAAPVVVEHVATRYRLADEALDRSWRSSRVVLDAVNDIFRDVQDRWVFAHDDVDRAIADDWARSFSEHRPARDLPGHVRLDVGPCDPGRSSDRPLLMAYTADRIAALHREAPGCSIGVLTRTNATVARLILELRRLGIDASEEGGTRLVDSAAVASVLALLRLADHPADSLAAYHVAHTPVGEAVGLTDPKDEAGAERVAAWLRRRLMDDGYGPTLTDLAHRLAHACDDRERARLGQLAELGYRYEPVTAGGGDAGASSTSLRVDDFVRLAETSRAESPGSGQVRVMTVHKAKGLEFDAVVLPELDEPMTGRGGDGGRPLTRRPGGTGRVTHVFPPMSADVRRVFGHIPELREAFAQARADKIRDALSVLYVAATRPRHALHMIIAADGDRGPGTTKSHARLVRQALAPATLEKGARIDEGDVIFESGDPDWFRALGPTAAAGPGTASSAGAHAGAHAGTAAPATGTRATGTPATGAPTPIRLRSAAGRTRSLDRRKPSELEGGPAIELRDVLGLETSIGALERGSVIHAWLEAMEWVDGGLPDADRLRAIARRVAPRMAPEDVAGAARSLHGWLQATEVRAALSRDRYDGDATVEAEMPFLRRDGDVLMEGFIDRLVLVRERGRVVRAEILDYKTDALDPGDDAKLAARAEHYAPQLHAYRRAVAEMYGLALPEVGAALVFLAAGRVVAVDAASERVHA